MQEDEGTYFGLESMRERAPLLFEEHVTNYQPVADVTGPTAKPPAFSDMLLAMHLEKQHRERVKAEQVQTHNTKQNAADVSFFQCKMYAMLSIYPALI